MRRRPPHPADPVRSRLPAPRKSPGTLRYPPAPSNILSNTSNTIHHHPAPSNILQPPPNSINNPQTLPYIIPRPTPSSILQRTPSNILQHLPTPSNTFPYAPISFSALRQPQTSSNILQYPPGPSSTLYHPVISPQPPPLTLFPWALLILLDRDQWCGHDYATHRKTRNSLPAVWARRRGDPLLIF